MAEFIIHQHHHYGWTKDTFQVSSLDEAVKACVFKYHPFLNDEYKGRFSIHHTIGNEKYPCYIVRWQDEAPILSPFGPIMKGDVWFSDRIEQGETDDCPECGGTGVNHYNPFLQCWACGDQEKDGKGMGKQTN